MNLSITPSAEAKFVACAKTNKRVHKGKSLPWYCIFEISGESIDVAESFPAEDQTLEVNADNWQSLIWEPLVDKIATKYAKNACMVVVEVVYTYEGSERNDPIFFKWCPDTGVPVRTKMLIGSSFQAAKKKLDVQGTTPEISQRSDLEFKNFAEQAQLKGY